MEEFVARKLKTSLDWFRTESNADRDARVVRLAESLGTGCTRLLALALSTSVNCWACEHAANGEFSSASSDSLRNHIQDTLRFSGDSFVLKKDIVQALVESDILKVKKNGYVFVGWKSANSRQINDRMRKRKSRERGIIIPRLPVTSNTNIFRHTTGVKSPVTPDLIVAANHSSFVVSADSGDGKMASRKHENSQDSPLKNPLYTKNLDLYDGLVVNGGVGSKEGVKSMREGGETREGGAKAEINKILGSEKVQNLLREEHLSIGKTFLGLTEYLDLAFTRERMRDLSKRFPRVDVRTIAIKLLIYNFQERKTKYSNLKMALDNWVKMADSKNMDLVQSIKYIDIPAGQEEIAAHGKS